ncbi:hypothetical protein Pint_12265 [Pistacia integerrima]|uniref:Uncharacterized protein n=1 Tax=Pistacia integerrima TaxID=434235 RepID=A0ACC0XHJ0_9ROSI|nr:hypothetical protein Pint_12265 [Pistacia integerrima]
MATNYRVTVDIPPQMDELHETENELVTSPKEHNEFPVDAPNNSSEIIEPDHASDEVNDSEFPTIEDPPRKIFGVSSFLERGDETRIRHLNLYLAAFKGDWDAAVRIYQEYPTDISARITKEGHTALHVAASANHTQFVKQLVNRMTRPDLALMDHDGNTALLLAAGTGNVELLRMMLNKNETLAIIRSWGMLPLQRAALLGHRDMVVFLYEITLDHDLNDEDRIELFITFINTSFYDVALRLIERYPELAIVRDRSEETALHALGRKRSLSSNFTDQNQRGFWKRFLNLFSGSNNRKMNPQAVALVKHIWKQVILLGDSEISEIISFPRNLFFDAAKQGNAEFLTLLINEYPGLILKVNSYGYSIFHLAVLYRQEDLFKLIYEIGSFKDILAAHTDKYDDNMLHLAGRLPPADRLSVVSGDALQMQRELLWFKEVSKVVQPLYAEAKNWCGKTPTDIFAEEHKSLMESGEKWIKETANSCMLVATLITSVVFTATFQVPIGNERDTSVPLLIQRVSFGISLISSSISIITFLSLYTSPYEEEDFLVWLPAKLAFGILTLSTSIVAMMVIFLSTFFMVFDQGMLGFVIIVSIVAAVPLTLFLKQQLGLLWQVIRSTYMSSTLFHSKKRTLFYKEKARKSVKEKKDNGYSKNA